MATVNTFKYRGHDRLARVFGRHSIEHSYVRLAEVWCDGHGEPLKNPETGELYPELTVRGALNPGAINPENGCWTAMKFSSLFNRFLPKPDAGSNKRFKLGVFSLYGGEFGEQGIFNPDVAVADPIIADTGDQFSMEAEWLARQHLGLLINKEKFDYDLGNCNCHTMTVALNKKHPDAVEKFAKNSLLRLGATPDKVQISEDVPRVPQSLEELQHINLLYANAINEGHQIRAAQYQQRHGLMTDHVQNEPDIS